MDSQPGSNKNYRDEFDALFPNRRRGWHKRPTREYCRGVLDIQSNVLVFKLLQALDRSSYTILISRPCRRTHKNE
jgi:hypothetical protein